MRIEYERTSYLFMCVWWCAGPKRYGWSDLSGAGLGTETRGLFDCLSTLNCVLEANITERYGSGSVAESKFGLCKNAET
jgi:hypothetical protein